MKRIVLHISRATMESCNLLFLVALVLFDCAFAGTDGGWLACQIWRLSSVPWLNAPVVLGELTGEFYHFNPAVGIESLVVYQPLDPDRSQALSFVI